MVDKRVERSRQSVTELRNFLHRVCESPVEYLNDEQLRQSLKSQGALSKFCREEMSILPTSINTMKRIAGDHIEGGFEALDILRIRARERIEESECKATRSNKRTRAGLAKRVTELEEQIETLETVNYALIQSLTDAVNDIRSIADADSKESRRHRSREACKRLVSMMAINPSPFDRLRESTNVVALRDE